MRRKRKEVLLKLDIERRVLTPFRTMNYHDDKMNNTVVCINE